MKVKKNNRGDRMGFLEKVKNMFTEEVEETPIKKEVMQVEIPAPTPIVEEFNGLLINSKSTFSSFLCGVHVISWLTVFLNFEPPIACTLD